MDFSKALPQKLKTRVATKAAFQAAIQSGLSPTQAVREVSKRIDMFATLMTPSQQIGDNKCN